MDFAVISHYLEMDRKDRQRYPELYGLKSPSTISVVNPRATTTSVGWSSQSQVSLSRQSPLPPLRNETDSIPAETAHITDYMCWSFVNFFLGSMFLGVISIILSYSVRNHKIDGDVKGAQSMSVITALWNSFLTLASLSAIVVLSLKVSRYL